jgi:proline racemase
MESPAGLIEVKCQCSNGKVTQVEFKNVPSFLMNADRMVEVKSVGTIKVDIAYGGIIYAITDAVSFGFRISEDEARDMVLLGQKIRAACNEQCVSIHPENPEINKVANVIFAGPLESYGDRVVAKNATMCNLGRLDRSPCGTGSAARLAVMKAKEQIKGNEIFESVSITGTKFICRIVETCQIGNVKGIIPTIAGQAWITAIIQYGIDPTDPFQHGHKLGDVWF